MGRTSSYRGDIIYNNHAKGVTCLQNYQMVAARTHVRMNTPMGIRLDGRQTQLPTIKRDSGLYNYRSVAGGTTDREPPIGSYRSVATVSHVRIYIKKNTRNNICLHIWLYFFVTLTSTTAFRATPRLRRCSRGCRRTFR